jgi:protein-S-isoprenylcysteine O-methyltransferase Ste14
MRFLPAAVFAITVASWIGFGLVFLLRGKPAAGVETKREPASRWGIFLQMIAFALVWSAPRNPLTPIMPMPDWLQLALGIFTAAVAIAALWISIAAVRALGAQWAFDARLIEGHKLITQGPYRFVRNPIYLGIFGMILSTGLAMSRWWLLAIAITLFLIGNAIRIRSEEKLLRESFGAEFEDYARRVPAMFPRIP